MQLHYVNRSEYRRKNDAGFLEEIKQQFGQVYILPEGGSNSLAIKGCAETVKEINDDMDKPFDVICCASGTGATLAGLASAISPSQTAIGFSAVKNGGFLEHEVETFLYPKGAAPDHLHKNWRIETHFHFGGYAKIDDDLIEFMSEFQSQHGFALDAVYTGKMFYGLFELIKSNSFKPGTTIIAVHSGGLQGNKGFNL